MPPSTPSPEHIDPTLTPAELPWVSDAYEILEEIERDEHGILREARDRSGFRPVTLRLLASPSPWVPISACRFTPFRERLEALDDPNLIRVIDSGYLQGLPYIVQEHWGRQRLSDLLTGEPLPLASALEVVEELARALDRLHQQGLIYGDLHPSKIVLHFEPDCDAILGRPKLTNFGLGYLLAEQGEADGFASEAELLREMARRATLCGSDPTYQAPEQIQGQVEDIGPATDVHALGCLLYHLITGRPPFEGRSHELINKVVHAVPKPPSEVIEHLPPSLDAVCLRALEKDPRKRYSTAAAFADALGQAPKPPSAWRRLPLPRGKAGKATASMTALALLILWMGFVVSGGEPGSSPRPGPPNQNERDWRATDLDGILEEQARGRINVEEHLGALSQYLDAEAPEAEPPETVLDSLAELHRWSKTREAASNLPLRLDAALLSARVLQVGLEREDSEVIRASLPPTSALLGSIPVRAPRFEDRDSARAGAWLTLGQAESELQRGEAARTAFEHASMLAQAQLHRNSEDVAARLLLARATSGLASSTEPQGDGSEVLKLHRKSVVMWGELRERDPRNEATRTAWLRAVILTAQRMRALDWKGSSAPMLEEVLGKLARWDKDSPLTREQAEHRIVAARLLGEALLGAPKKRPRAKEVMELGLDELEGWLGRKIRLAPREHGRLLALRAELHALERAHPEAERDFEHAEQLQRAALEAHPQEDGLRADLASTLIRRMRLAPSRERLPFCDEVVRLAEEVESPSPELNRLAISALSARIRLHSRANRPREAAADWDRLAVRKELTVEERIERLLHLAKVGEHERVRRGIDSLLETEEPGLTAAERYNLACAHGLLIKHLDHDSAKKDCTEQGLRLLRRAARDWDRDRSLLLRQLQEDPDLQPLRRDARFTELVNALEKELSDKASPLAVSP